MPRQISDSEFLAHAAELVLKASVKDLLSIWNITDEFSDSRSKLLIPADKPSRPFLHISSGLMDVYKKDRKPSLLDNALLAVAAAIHIGLEDDSDIHEAVRLLLAEPLAKPGARVQILKTSAFTRLGE